MKIDIIYLDTSIWESNNFLESDRIKQLIKLCRDRNVKLIMPQLTYDEILNRLKINAESAISKLKKHRDETRVLRNIPKLISKFDLLDQDSTINELISHFRSTIDEIIFVIIEYQSMDIKTIFNSYFNKEFPFGPNGKKDEFSDAFALRIVENWAIDNKQGVITFSKDNDFLQYKSKNLDINDSFDKYLSDKLKEISTINIQFLEEAIGDDHMNLVSKIEDWVLGKLDDYSKYYDVSNYLEVHDIEIINTEVELGEYEITHLEDNYIYFQIKADIEFEVEVTINDENYMYKDEDTKSWVSFQSRIEEVKRRQTIPIDMRYEPVPIDEGPGLIEIIKVNEDKDLNI